MIIFIDACILAVNPSTMTAFNDILGLTGTDAMNPSGVFMATAISACIGTLLMAILSICFSTWNGIKRIFLLYRSSKYGI